MTSLSQSDTTTSGTRTRLRLPCKRLPIRARPSVRSPATSRAWLTDVRLSQAADPADHFLELSDEQSTTIHDLATVQTILPGRFTVIGTTIDNPDVIKLS